MLTLCCFSNTSG